MRRSRRRSRHTSVSSSLRCSSPSPSLSSTRSLRFFFRLQQKPFRPQKQAQVNGMVYLRYGIRADLQEKPKRGEVKLNSIRSSRSSFLGTSESCLWNQR